MVEGKSDNMSMNEIREEFKPEFTDEKRNEWLKWIDERSKQYSIEPLTIKKLSKDSNGDSNLDTVVYQTSYGTLEVQEQFVENFVTKPVDSIMKSRGKRDPLVIGQPETSFNLVIPSTDPPNRYEYYPTYDLMDLYMNQKRDYTKFCEDLYENYQEKDFDTRGDAITFDDVTGELCLRLIISDVKQKIKTSGMQIIIKLLVLKLFSGTLKFKLFIKKSQHHRLMDINLLYLGKLKESRSLFSNFEDLQRNYFHLNGIERINDPALFFNRKLSNLATSFMKKIQQDLIELCLSLNISFHGKKASTAVSNRVFLQYKNQGLNYFISQSYHQVTIKCSNRNIFVNIDALKRSKYFRFGLEGLFQVWDLTILENSRFTFLKRDC